MVIPAPNIAVHPAASPPEGSEDLGRKIASLLMVTGEQLFLKGNFRGAMQNVLRRSGAALESICFALWQGCFLLGAAREQGLPWPSRWPSLRVCAGNGNNKAGQNRAPQWSGR